ncbi:hypothetical protein RCH10_005538 [Variovorax sp. GrIS 2.14]
MSNPQVVDQLSAYSHETKFAGDRTNAWNLRKTWRRTLSLPMRDTDFLCGSISALSDRLHRSQQEVLDDPIHRVGVGDRPHMP